MKHITILMATVFDKIGISEKTLLETALFKVGTLLLFSVFTLPIMAQHPSKERLAERLTATDKSETLGAFYTRVVAELAAPKADEETDKAAKVTGNQPAITGASTGFGTRVGDTLTNFQPIFGFAINAVTTADDDKSVTVDYNPIRVGKLGAIKISTSISEPQPAADLLGKIIEDSRESQKEAIGKTLDDFDDITTSLTYGYQRSSGQSWQEQKRLWGRNPKLYEGFAKRLLAETWMNLPSRQDNDEFLVKIQRELGTGGQDNILELTFQDVESSGTSIDEMRMWIIDEVIKSVNRSQAFADFNIPKLGHLIDDQPTFTITAAYQNRDDFVGRDSFSAAVKFEKGRLNINRVRSEAKEKGGLLAAYQHVLEERDKKPKDRVTFSINYKWLDDRELNYAYTQTLTDPSTGEINRFPREASVSMEKSEELTARFTYSYSIEQQARTIDDVEVYPRIDFSVLYTDPISDDTRDDRVIAQLAYNLPVLKGMSLPVTLTYSSDPEFLGDQDTGFSARLGLNYGLSRLFEKKN